jgi:hypothetical protein
MASDIATLMVMPWEIQMKIFASLDFEFEKIWENDLKTCYSIMDLHNFLVPSNHDYEKQMSIILLHIHLGAISCLIINVYVECFYKCAYSKHSMNLYHPIGPKCFKKLDHTSSYFVELLCQHGWMKGWIIIIVVNLQVAWYFNNDFNHLWVKAKPLVNPLPHFFLYFTYLQ